jgi:hypothetical protein
MLANYRESLCVKGTVLHCGDDQISGHYLIIAPLHKFVVCDTQDNPDGVAFKTHLSTRCIPKSFFYRKHHPNPSAWRHVLRPRHYRLLLDRQCALRASVSDNASSTARFIPFVLIRLSSQWLPPLQDTGIARRKTRRCLSMSSKFQHVFSSANSSRRRFKPTFWSLCCSPLSFGRL